MDKKRKLIGLTLLMGSLYAGWKWAENRKRIQHVLANPPDDAVRLLTRSKAYLRLPTSPEQEPEVLPDGSGLRCPVTGKVYRYHHNILWLLPEDRERTITQKALDTEFSAWLYDIGRSMIVRALGSLDFDQDVALTQKSLCLTEGDAVLDLACGHGNFTVEWAKRVGESGLVIGLDYSPVMLLRAAYHIQRWGLHNVLLVHGDAHSLPFASGSFEKVNCSGGFHQFPDLPRALQEITRVSTHQAILTASTFAEGANDPHVRIKRWLQRYFDLNFVRLPVLSSTLSDLGYTMTEMSLPGGWFGYTAAIRE